MKKVLLATEKPFAAKAVAKIEEICKGAGYEFRRLEKYTSVDELKAPRDLPHHSPRHGCKAAGGR